MPEEVDHRRDYLDREDAFLPAPIADANRKCRAVAQRYGGMHPDILGRLVEQQSHAAKEMTCAPL